MKKRFLSILLVLCMVLCLVPTAVFAEGAPTGTPLTQALLGTWLEKEDPYNPNSGKIYKMPSGNYYLAEDIYLVGDDADPNSAWPLIISEGDVTLDLNGHVLDLKKQNICIYSNVSLTDSSPEAEHKFRVEDSGLWVLDETQGTETVTGGVITGGTGVDSSSGTLGGGVCVSYGSLTMNGGSIVGCTANNGGGASVFYGSFTMNSGSIAGCTAVKSGNAYGNGGGVYVGDSATFTMNDGSIVGCTADSGSVFVDGSATFNMNDGSIENCTADIGGGVYVGNLATFNMNDGSIVGCTADIGGGVYMGGLAKFNMKGGSIEGCTADNGGGVYVGGGAQFEMNSGGEVEGPTIKNCIAVRAGGGVFVDGSATFTMNGGSIANCKAGGAANAVHADGNFTDNRTSTIDKSLVSGINAGHTGSETDPILIGSAEGLKNFRDKVNNGQTGLCAKLVCDIVLNDGTFDENGTYMGANGSTSAEQWTPIGDSSNLYAGTFDGGGHTIKGLYVDGEQIAGLFGEIGGATIRDVTVDGYVKGTSVAGGIVGTASNSATSIQNCVNRCYVVAESSSGTSSGYAGGIVGSFSDSRISGCANTGAVSGFTNVGGIAGWLAGGSISSCYNTGTVEGTNQVGGVAGWLTGNTGGSGSISSCYNTGTVSGTTNVGGVAGYASASTVSSCYNTGTVSGTTNVGGVAGWFTGNTGGSGSISSCYNTGAVSGTTNVGGVVGCVLAAQGTEASVSDCYNTGKVSGDKQVGGFAGTVEADEDANASITSCCCLTGTAEKTIGENAEGTVTSVDAKTKAEFADGTVLKLLKQNDTTNAWDVCGYLEAAGMTLPLLKWQTLNARKYDIYITGVQITSLNQNDVLGDGKVSFVYDETNKKGILTLDGVNIVCNDLSDDNQIYAPDMENLEIVLKGENKIEAEWLAGIMADNLTFSGEGSIEISTDCNFNWPVSCDRTFTVNGGNVKISSIDYALLLDGALTVNGGTLELIASGEYGYAIDIGFNDLNVVLADDRIMITGTNPDGSDARITAASEVDTVKAARYVKILSKYIPIVYDPGQYGTGDAVTEYKTYGEDFGLSDAMFTLVGYKQTSWTTADNGGEILRLGSAYSGNEPLKLYPVWEIEQYGITYDLDGGTVTGNPDSYSIESEGFTLNNPEREGGYEFAGWSGTDLEGNDNMTVTVPKGSTGSRNYKAHWKDIQAPVINGLEDGKIYCSAVEFTAADNDGIASVTVNGTAISAEGGKYTLLPAQGTQIVVVTDNAGNSVEVTVTVNDGHTYEWQSENGQYWQKCKFCGFETDKKDIPTISINGADEVCRTQDYTYTFTISEDCPFVIGGYAFENLGDDLTATQENGLYTATVGASCYQIDENSFKVTVLAETADGYAFGAEKTVNILDQHIGGTATCTEKAKCDVCGEEYGELDSDNHTGEAEWIKTDKTHEKKYTCCGAVEIAESAHEYDNDSDATCNICGYERKIEPTTTTEPTTAEKTTAASTPSDKPVNTGAESAMGLALFMAAGAIGMISAKRRRK